MIIGDMITVICKKTGIDTLCQEEERKNSIFPKWWCPNCHRYVLPDGKYHWSAYAKKDVPPGPKPYPWPIEGYNPVA